MKRISIGPYWTNIVEYYYSVKPVSTSTRFIGISIWQWLERDYGAIRIHTKESIRSGAIDHAILQFNDEADATAFVIRWV